ncbi:MAG TPA: sulfatase [Candidatus Sulfotelmatobacter sp.]|nr:sulfatase [Candidatus Sulfotelmatobacter sp.]
MHANLVIARVEREPAPPKETYDIPLRSGLALLSIITLVCLSLETELLQQIDSLRLYLTIPEIALELAVALLSCIAMAVCWWLLVLLIGQVAQIVFWRKPRIGIHLRWHLWLAPAFACLVLELLEDLKIEFLPHWHAGITPRFAVAFGLIGLCVAGFFAIGWPLVQKFCRTRLAPIAWLHIAIGLLASGAAWRHGVHIFADYERPSTATVVTHLPDIYLITIDTIRADATSVYGYQRATTPNLEKFAQRSFTFDYDFANSNFTTPSTSTIETGKLPWTHRVFQAGGFLRGRNQQENVAQILQQKGYYTAMVSSNLLAAPFRHRTLESYSAVQYASPRGFTGLRFRETNLVGLNTQFTLAYSLIRPLTSIADYLDQLISGCQYPSPAEDVFGRSKKFLERHAGQQPMFLWAHIMPPHDPYWVPSPYRHRFVSKQAQSYDNYKVPDSETRFRGVPLQELRGAYDEMILYADHEVGEFLDWLDQTGRLDRAIVIVSADHGELFDHNRLAHAGPDLYNGVIHIPLLFHLPGQKQGVRIQDLAQQADLLPTILDLIGAPIPNWTEGISLKPAIEG